MNFKKFLFWRPSEDCLAEHLSRVAGLHSLHLLKRLRRQTSLLWSKIHSYWYLWLCRMDSAEEDCWSNRPFSGIYFLTDEPQAKSELPYPSIHLTYFVTDSSSRILLHHMPHCRQLWSRVFQFWLDWQQFLSNPRISKKCYTDVKYRLIDRCRVHHISNNAAVTGTSDSDHSENYSWMQLNNFHKMVMRRFFFCKYLISHIGFDYFLVLFFSESLL